METEQNQDNNVNIIPEYTQIKRVILQQFYTAQHNMTEYTAKPTQAKEKRLRSSLYDLANSLSFKSYVLTDQKIKKVFADFLSKPYNYHKFSLHLVYGICHLIIEILGLTKIESEDLTNENVFQEV